MKLVVTGHSEHGKDEVCNILKPILPFKGSSEVACEVAVYSTLKPLYGYSSVQECFDDRRNHKSEWYELIKDYNKDDLSKLGRMILNDNDIYCGLRNIAEYNKLKSDGLVDFMIWVDASKRKPPQGSDSMSITKEHADVILDNNGTLADLPLQVTATFIKLLQMQLN